VAVDLGYALLIGFGSTRLTELWKEVATRLGLHQTAWWKAAVNLLVCGGLALLIVRHSWDTRVLVAVGASGVAMLIHALDTFLRHHRDRLVAEVLGRRPRR
jgi:predicted cobalt transporter CbtA